MSVTKNLAKYIGDMGINLSELSRKSGVSYSSLYASVGGDKRNRDLRADELTSICLVLHVNPMDFADDSMEKEKQMKNSVKEKPTLNDIRKNNGLNPIPGGDAILTKA